MPAGTRDKSGAWQQSRCQRAARSGLSTPPAEPRSGCRRINAPAGPGLAEPGSGASGRRCRRRRLAAIASRDCEDCVDRDHRRSSRRWARPAFVLSMPPRTPCRRFAIVDLLVVDLVVGEAWGQVVADRSHRIARGNAGAHLRRPVQRLLVFVAADAESHGWSAERFLLIGLAQRSSRSSATATSPLVAPHGPAVGGARWERPHVAY
jgi:hypothetical protein